MNLLFISRNQSCQTATNAGLSTEICEKIRAESNTAPHGFNASVLPENRVLYDPTFSKLLKDPGLIRRLFQSFTELFRPLGSG